MYVKTCVGGYPNPIFGGRMEVLGFRATVASPSAASRIQIWDDANIVEGGNGYIRSIDEDVKVKIADAKGESDVDDNIEVIFPESLKTRRGLSAAFTNIEPGTFMLYIK